MTTDCACRLLDRYAQAARGFDCTGAGEFVAGKMECLQNANGSFLTAIKGHPGHCKKVVTAESLVEIPQSLRDQSSQETRSTAPSEQSCPTASGELLIPENNDSIPKEVPPAGIKVYAYVPPLAKEYLSCPICHKLWEKPVAVKNRCKHVFCRECVQESFRNVLERGLSEYTCPVCAASEPVQWEAGTWKQPELEPSLLAEEMLQSLQVHCRFGLRRNRAGVWAYPGDRLGCCPAVLKQTEVRTHEATCKHALIQCPIPRCGAIVLRSKITEHLVQMATKHCELAVKDNMALKEALNSTQTKLKESQQDVRSLKDKIANLEARVEEKETSLMLHRACQDANAAMKNLTNVTGMAFPPLPDVSTFLSSRANENGAPEHGLEHLLPSKKARTKGPTEKQKNNQLQGCPKVPEQMPVSKNQLCDSQAQLFAPLTSLGLGGPNILSEDPAPGLDNGNPAEAPVCRFNPIPDGYNWRKYGEKRMKQSPFIRTYYKCSVSGCPMRKIIEFDGEGQLKGSQYKGEAHNHEPPANARTGQIKPKRPV